MTQNISRKLSQFPIYPHLDEICNALKTSESHFLVLTAQTGAGKSTILPVGLLENFEEKLPGKILMTEPRRLAVLGVANRISDLLDSPCGQTCGYKIHLENKTSQSTRLEIVTEAILVRYLQNDPVLEDYSVVILDEFHERSVYTDLNLAFLKEAMQLRDDLFVIIMSATIDTQKIVEYLSDGNCSGKSDSAKSDNSSNSVPVINIPGRLFPIQTVYKPQISVEQAILDELFSKNTSVKKGDGILVFLPGIQSIKKCAEYLQELLNQQEEINSQNSTEIEISILHSSINLKEQKYIISGGNKATVRIILSSAIAETSLTVPGITCVIDSGLTRVNRINVSTGMENLITENESVFSAEQRKGRAGREREGKCIRLWQENEPRIKELAPEILRTDLTSLVLECVDRGIYNLSSIKWLDFPPQNSWNTSKKLLQDLQLLTDDGRITPKGKVVLSLGIEIRLACIAIDSKLLNCPAQAEKLILTYSSFSGSSKEMQNNFCADLQRRLSRIKSQDLQNISPLATAKELLILAGYPDRLAKRISEKGTQTAEYQFPSGRKAIIAETTDHPVHQHQKDSEWIVAPEVLAGTTEGIIFSFYPLQEDVLQENAHPENALKVWLKNHSVTKTVCSFENGKIKKMEQTVYGELILSQKKLTAQKEDFAAAWITEIRKKGLSCLPIDSKTEDFLNRAKFYNQQIRGETAHQESTAGAQTATEQTPPELPSETSPESTLAEKAEDWLLPFIQNSSPLNAQTVYDALFWFLNGQEIQKLVPESILLENGKKCKVKYELLASPQDKTKLIIRPVIEIIIQRIFGCTQTPQIMGTKILFRLLSPANRPLQITDDLEGFWNGSWKEICKEMKGRYPKHNWQFTI